MALIINDVGSNIIIVCTAHIFIGHKQVFVCNKLKGTLQLLSRCEVHRVCGCTKNVVKSVNLISGRAIQDRTNIANNFVGNSGKNIGGTQIITIWKSFIV